MLPECCRLGTGQPAISCAANMVRTSFTMIQRAPSPYRKTSAAWLVASDVADDREAQIKQVEFLARASKLANDKARELGWIVED
jgi:hypothetical protein